MAPILLFSVVVIATCGLIYELIAGTVASYLLGDSVTQFSTIIGCYLFAMGIGSWLSRYVTRNLISFFVKVEILVGAIGGCSAAVLFMLFEHVHSFRFLLYFIVGLIGILVGIEVPLLMRILKDKLEFRDLVSKVLAFDYIGALFASILFPLLLIPYLGLIKTSFLFGLMNVGVALWVLYAIEENTTRNFLHKLSAIVVLVGLTLGFVYSESLMSIAESSTYQGRIIFSESTPYQRIVITKASRDIRLFLNGNLQFSSVDEYRYHEALVHPVMSAMRKPEHVLIIGGGDGMALREVLKYPSVSQVTLVDLDPAMTRLFSSNDMLTELNQQSLRSDKLTVINQDAFVWLKELGDTQVQVRYDAVIIDLPDPSNYSVGKLYSLQFFRLLHGVMTPQSIAVVQSTSPLVARKSFWCVNNTLEAAGFHTAPYHAYVPSFGEWGYVIATEGSYTPPAQYPVGLKYVSQDTAREMFHFPADMSKVATRIQRLDDQALVRYFDKEWSEYLVY
ncbi:MAG TPA: polyamine aminopropyltransferase [Gallionellaceae bacterium]